MASYIDEDLLQRPLNGLTTSTELLNEQYSILTGPKTITSTDLDVDAFKAQPVDVSTEMYEIQQTVGNSDNIDAISPSTPDVENTTPEYYNGPRHTGKTIGSVAKEYGFPTSVQQTIDDAQDAVLGITKDLTQSGEKKESLYDILTKDNRLRGIGALLIITAVVAFIVKILAGT